MKSVEQLNRLQENPFYEFSEEEQKLLDESGNQDIVSSVEEDKQLPKGYATSEEGVAVKETGRVDKHPSDPVAR